MPPLALTALGFAAGGLLGLAVVARRRGGLSRLRQPPLAWAHGVGGLFGYHALYFAALATAPPVEANLVNYAWPLLVVLFSAPVLGMPLGPRRLAGVALGALGCALLIGPGVVGEGNAAAPAPALGFLCAAGAALVWALYSVTSRRMAAVPTEAVAGFCLATAALAAIAHFVFEPPVGALSAEQWLAVLLLGAGPLGAAFFLWDIGMKRGDPRLLGTLAYATPVASTLLLLAAGEGAFTWPVAAAVALVASGGWLAANTQSISRNSRQSGGDQCGQR